MTGSEIFSKPAHPGVPVLDSLELDSPGPVELDVDGSLLESPPVSELDDDVTSLVDSPLVVVEGSVVVSGVTPVVVACPSLVPLPELVGDGPPDVPSALVLAPEDPSEPDDSALVPSMTFVLHPARLIRGTRLRIRVCIRVLRGRRQFATVKDPAQGRPPEKDLTHANPGSIVRRMQKTLSFLSGLLLLALPACGDSGNDTEDTANTTTVTGSSMSMPTSGATDDPTGGAAPTCADYCTAVTTNCTTANTFGQYFDGTDAGVAACTKACESFPAGTAADMAGNTLGCRAYHAGAAAGDAATHCVHAGPSGGGVCGTGCEGFCAIALDVCPMAFADEAACTTACAGFMDDTATYTNADMAGNNLSCRLYHLTAAAVDAATHCAHITADSPPCM